MAYRYNDMKVIFSTQLTKMQKNVGLTNKTKFMVVSPQTVLTILLQIYIFEKDDKFIFLGF